MIFLEQHTYQTESVYFIRLLRLAATALRLRFSHGVSQCRWYLTSAKIPALDTWRLNRRKAESMPSFSPRTTWVIRFPHWSIVTILIVALNLAKLLYLVRRNNSNLFSWGWLFRWCGKIISWPNPLTPFHTREGGICRDVSWNVSTFVWERFSIILRRSRIKFKYLTRWVVNQVNAQQWTGSISLGVVGVE